MAHRNKERRSELSPKITQSGIDIVESMSS